MNHFDYLDDTDEEFQAKCDVQQQQQAAQCQHPKQSRTNLPNLWYCPDCGNLITHLTH